jgi:hypothetical protein
LPATMIVQAFPVCKKRKAAARSKKKVFMCNMIFLFCDLSGCNVAIFILTKKLKA